MYNVVYDSNPIIENKTSYEFINKINGRLKFQVNNSMVLPISFANLNIGALELYNKNGNFSYNDINKVDMSKLSKLLISYYNEVDITGSLELSITQFTALADNELKNIWYAINMLKRIDDFEDNDSSRKEYQEKIFNKYNAVINKHINTLDSSLNNLNQFCKKTIEGISEYLALTYGDVSPECIEKCSDKYNDINLTIDMIVRDKEALEVYLDDNSTDSKHKKYILSAVGSINNINDFYEQTKNSISIIKLDNITDMLNNTQEDVEDEFLGMTVEQEVSNGLISNKIDRSIKQLIKFHKNVKSISYFAKSPDFRFFSRELSYFKDYIANIIKQKYAQFYYEQEVYNIEVDISLDGNCVFKTDAFKLEEAIDAILENSAEELAEKEARNGAFEKKIAVKIGLNDEDSYIYIDIADNGRGIKADTLDKIYDKYFSLGKRGSNGIGLTLAKDIIESGLKGELSVETHEGEGTIFSIKLPKTK